jgi:hypothetical protein
VVDVGRVPLREHQVPLHRAMLSAGPDTRATMPSPGRSDGS